MRRTSFVSLSLALVLPAQRLITTQFGTTPGGETGTVVCATGDMDGDDTPDFLVSSPGITPGTVQLVSGRTRAVLRTYQGTGNGLGHYDIVPLGDVDGDGAPDFVMPTVGLDAYSGGSGVRLWRAGPPVSYSQYACAVGDVNGDGAGDLADIVYLNSNYYLWILDGRTGGQVTTLSTSLQGIPRQMCGLGDIDGDGRAECAMLTNTSIVLCGTTPPRILRTIQVSNTQFKHLEAADMNGDGRNELLVSTNESILLYSATTGALLRTLQNPANEAAGYADGNFVMFGDLNQDGLPDIVRFNSYSDTSRGVPYRRVFLESGLDGSLMGSWSATYDFRMYAPHFADVGDIDGDGYHDLLIGDNQAGVDPSSYTGGWQLVSGKVLASVRSFPVQCGGGPFFPELGVTRPVMGQPLTLVGRDCPPQAVGTVILSLVPAYVHNLGVAGCDAYFDFGTWRTFYSPPMGASWQLTVPLPNVPQLVGWQLALQMIYGPTLSPIGMDLSNGVWVRLGY